MRQDGVRHFVTQKIAPRTPFLSAFANLGRSEVAEKMLTKSDSRAIEFWSCSRFADRSNTSAAFA